MNLNAKKFFMRFIKANRKRRLKITAHTRDTKIEVEHVILQ